MSATDSLPPATPLDVRRGLTRASDVAFPLRWGILGAGSISAQWVESLRACKGATVTAVAAREQARAQTFADALDIPKAYDSYADMAAADDVDIVYVGTITRLHKEHSLIAIEAGKHVLCEKPLADNVDDVRAMYAAAEARGVMLQDAMWTRFFPAVEHARHAIETGVIGDVSFFNATATTQIYTIQAAPLAFGADAVATKVTASGLRGGGAAIVEYGDRGFAVLTFPPFNCELGEVTEIAGTKGRIMLGQPGHCPTDITIRVPPPNGVPSRYRSRNAASPEQRFDYPLPGNVAMARAFPNQHGFLYQAEAVHRCLAAGLRECPQYGQADSLHAMDLLTRIQQARRESARG